MKHLSTKAARSTWLFPTADIDQQGRFLVAVFPELVKRYRFATVPNQFEAARANNGIRLESGAFSRGRQGQTLVDLAIFNDGLVADSHVSTEVSDAFLEDVCEWAAKEHGLLRPKNVRKLYQSEIYVEAAAPLARLSKMFGQFSKILTERMPGLTAGVVPEISGLTFSSARTNAPAVHVFKFERATESLYSEDRYYSAASVSTEAHLELLKALEAVVPPKS